MRIDRFALCCLALSGTVSVVACGGGGGSTGSTTPIVAPTTSPSTSPTATPSSAPVPASSYVCPSSSSVSTSVARGASAADSVRRNVNRVTADAAPSSSLLAVTYDRTTALQGTATIAASEARAGVTLVHAYDFVALNHAVRVVAVPASRVASATAVLRAQPGVERVEPTGVRRSALTVAQPYYPTDPYFNGFMTTVAPSAGATPSPPTYHVPPYSESSNVPGQWGMHAVRLEYAFAYANAGNGSNVSNPAALGSSNVRIAIIDTGSDPNHPELQPKIAYQHCFLTNASGVQSTGSFAPDPSGHGTDVAGIAAAATNNGFGFTGAGGATMIDAYRVFPTPDDACATPESTDAACTADSNDIASAIDDAVTQHVNIISLSLGGGSCTNGADPDVLEGDAVAEAIASNIIVIASSGNTGTAGLAAPACDTGVIAAGATALADGATNGSGVTGGSVATPLEYVPAYSQYGSPAALPGSNAAWGIVAPGGDPMPDPNKNDTTGATADLDDLHYIENIWTTTPFDAKFAGGCESDYGTTSVNDCRVLIAGTSMSAPLVAGAAALIVAVAPRYQSATAMKTLLCTTADNIGDAHEGCGRLNVERAMAIALGDSAPP